MEALARDYRHAEVVDSHCHCEDQLIFATRGIMEVLTDRGNWIIPSGHALWVPAAVGHEIRMTGEVCMRTLLLKPAVQVRQAANCHVIHVSGLLRELIVALVRSTDSAGDLRTHCIRELINIELQSARQVDLHIPMPRDHRLRALCDRFLDDPALELTLEQCGVQMNMSSRTLARLFQRELAMPFGEWRTRARLVLSQQRLARGTSILDVALEHGYQSASAFTAMFKRTFGYTPRRCQAIASGSEQSF